MQWVAAAVFISIAGTPGSVSISQLMRSTFARCRSWWSGWLGGFDPPARPADTLTVELTATWPIGRAGLVGPAAWLTAPRETPEFAARRGRILAAYDRADAPVAAMLERYGWAA